MSWPHDEICLFLKNRSRSLSLHYTDDKFVEGTPHQVIFEEGRQMPNEASQSAFFGSRKK
jgi:hypothetical protein